MKALKAFYAQARVAFEPHFSRKQIAQLKAICRQVMRAGGCDGDDSWKCDVFRALIMDDLLHHINLMNMAVLMLNNKKPSNDRNVTEFTNSQNMLHFTKFVKEGDAVVQDHVENIYHFDSWGKHAEELKHLYEIAAKIAPSLAWNNIYPPSTPISEVDAGKRDIQTGLLASDIQTALNQQATLDDLEQLLPMTIKLHDILPWVTALPPFTLSDIIKFIRFTPDDTSLQKLPSACTKLISTVDTVENISNTGVKEPSEKESGYATWYTQFQQYKILTNLTEKTNTALQCLISDSGEMRKINDFQQNTSEILGEAIRIYGIFSPLFHDDDEATACKQKTTVRTCQLQDESDCTQKHKQCRLFNITNPRDDLLERRTSLHLHPQRKSPHLQKLTGLQGGGSLCETVPATNQLLISPGNTTDLEQVCDVEALDKIMGIDGITDEETRADQRQQKWETIFNAEGFYEIFDPRIKLDKEKNEWGCHDFLKKKSEQADGDPLTSAGTYDYTETELIKPEWWTQPVHWYLGHLPPDDTDVEVSKSAQITVKHSGDEMKLWEQEGYDKYNDKAKMNAFGAVGKNAKPNFHNAGAFSTAINQISTGEKDVVMLASGYSGTGKTYTLLGTEKVPGLVRLSQANVSPTSRGKFMYAIELYGTVIPTSELILNRKTDTKAWTKCKCTHEVIVYHPPKAKPTTNTIVARLKTLLVDGNDIRYEVLQGAEDDTTIKTIQQALDNMDYRCKIESERWKKNDDKKWLKEDDYIGMIKRCRMLQRRVRATPNNTESSRGHTFYVYQWHKYDEEKEVLSQDLTKGFGTLTVGDMAGMEEEIPMVNEYFSIVVPPDNTVKPEEKLDRVMGHLYQKLLPTIDNMRTLEPDAEDFAGTNTSQLFMSCTRSADGIVNFTSTQDQYSTSMKCIFLNRKYHSKLYGKTLEHGKKLRKIETWIKGIFTAIEQIEPEHLQQAYQVFYDLLLGYGVSAYKVRFKATDMSVYDATLDDEDKKEIPSARNRKLQTKDQYPFLLAEVKPGTIKESQFPAFGKFKFNPLMFPLLKIMGEEGVDPDECLDMAKQRIAQTKLFGKGTTSFNAELEVYQKTLTKYEKTNMSDLDKEANVMSTLFSKNKFTPEHVAVWNQKRVENNVEQRVWNIILDKATTTSKTWKDLCSINAKDTIKINKNLSLVFQAPDTTKWEDFKAGAKYYLKPSGDETDFIYHSHPLNNSIPAHLYFRSEGGLITQHPMIDPILYHETETEHETRKGQSIRDRTQENFMLATEAGWINASLNAMEAWVVHKPMKDTDWGKKMLKSGDVLKLDRYTVQERNAEATTKAHKKSVAISLTATVGVAVSQKCSVKDHNAWYVISATKRRLITVTAGDIGVVVYSNRQLGDQADTAFFQRWNDTFVKPDIFKALLSTVYNTFQVSRHGRYVNRYYLKQIMTGTTAKRIIAQDAEEDLLILQYNLSDLTDDSQLPLVYDQTGELAFVASNKLYFPELGPAGLNVIGAQIPITTKKQEVAVQLDHRTFYQTLVSTMIMQDSTLFDIHKKTNTLNDKFHKERPRIVMTRGYDDPRCPGNITDPKTNPNNQYKVDVLPDFPLIAGLPTLSEPGRAYVNEGIKREQRVYYTVNRKDPEELCEKQKPPFCDESCNPYKGTVLVPNDPTTETISPHNNLICLAWMTHWKHYSGFYGCADITEQISAVKLAVCKESGIVQFCGNDFTESTDISQHATRTYLTWNTTIQGDNDTIVIPKNERKHADKCCNFIEGVKVYKSFPVYEATTKPKLKEAFDIQPRPQPRPEWLSSKNCRDWLTEILPKEKETISSEAQTNIFTTYSQAIHRYQLVPSWQYDQTNAAEINGMTEMLWALNKQQAEDNDNPDKSIAELDTGIEGKFKAACMIMLFLLNPDLGNGKNPASKRFCTGQVQTIYTAMKLAKVVTDNKGDGTQTPTPPTGSYDDDV